MEDMQFIILFEIFFIVNLVTAFRKTKIDFLLPMEPLVPLVEQGKIRVKVFMLYDIVILAGNAFNSKHKNYKGKCLAKSKKTDMNI